MKKTYFLLIFSIWLLSFPGCKSSSQVKEGKVLVKVDGEELTEEGIKCLRWALAGATSTGLLPEQVDKSSGKPAWAIPLGWSGSLMLDNILLLDKICRRNAGNNEHG